MSKEKQIDKEEMEEMWMEMLSKSKPVFEKITDDITEMAMDEIKRALEYIRSEVAAIDTNGQVDEYTKFIRTGEQVKQMVLDIIDNYKASIEEVE